jgi:hypothetical protein
MKTAKRFVFLHYAACDHKYSKEINISVEYNLYFDIKPTATYLDF